MDFWYGVYEDKISGKKPNIEALKQRTDIPKSILNKGGKAATEYLISLQKQGAERLKEIKVIFIGDGGAGKTSLIKKIFNIDAALPDNIAPTYGVDIDTFDVDTNNGEKIKAHFWDFGGQAIMHSTHKFFLSERSVYVIVADGRKEEDPSYWLEHVKIFGNNSCALVVMNKQDDNLYDLERNSLKRNYSNIKDFYKVSCKKPEFEKNELKEFIKDLKKAIIETKGWEQGFPKAWFEVKKSIDKIKSDFIHYEKFKEICEKNGLKEDKEQDNLINSLHSLGTSLYFENLKRFGTHILNPEWITTGVYKIITYRKLSELKGVFNIEILKDIFRDEKLKKRYPKRQHDFIMKLMEEFKLAYRIDDKNFIIPDLLDKDMPNNLDISEYEKGLVFRFSFPFFPTSIMPEFIVRMAKNNNINMEDYNCRWRNGALLENKKLYNANALALADNSKKAIDIFVIGGGRRDYFTIIRDKFHNIFNRFLESFEFKEQILISKKPEIYEDYEHLIGLERMGETEYLCGKLQKRFNLNQLLNGFEPYEKRRREERKQHIEFKPHMEFNPRIEVNPYIENTIKTDINIQVKNNAVSDINNILKALLKEAPKVFKDKKDSDKLSREIEIVKKAAEQIKEEQDNVKAKDSGAIIRVGNFIKKLSDKTARVGKLISKMEKGAELATKAATAWNTIAGWCA
ncbi:MAG: hypothetical protein JRJ49_02595 [Deltaproteobacteria bacterium]|nr:hypothetical protein [Deltaproteobacteria bacterium]